MTDAKLKSYVERIDRVMTAMDASRADIAQIIKDAKGDGYIPKTLRKVATRYHADPSKIATEDALLETYEAALGRVGKALQAISEGATWDEASKEHGVPRATMARAASVSKRRGMIPSHDPDTGEVRENVVAVDPKPMAKETLRAGTDAGCLLALAAPGQEAARPSVLPQRAEDSTDPAGCTKEISQECKRASISTPPVGREEITPTVALGAEPRLTGEPVHDDLAIPDFLRRVSA